MEIEKWKKANNLQSRIKMANSILDALLNGQPDRTLAVGDLKIVMPLIVEQFIAKKQELEKEFEAL